MSDEFETVNASRADRAREIEVMRAHYRRHRESLKRMAADAPTDALAQEYQRLVLGIDHALGKLDELEGGAPATPRPKTQPGMTPLVQPIAEPVYEDDATQVDYVPPERQPVSNTRLALIVFAGVLVLAAIGWLIWRASKDRSGTPSTATTVAETAPVTETPVETTAAEVAVATQSLSVTPQAHDYGAIRKGTRATRQYEVANASDEPIGIVVARSACRCLYYEHGQVVPPKGRETITVTIDGAKAKAGELNETVKVSSKADPKIVTSFDVTATIR